MAGTKRKRSSGRSYRRSYKRSRGVSTSSVVRALAKANRPAGPFGPGTENYARYGPSRRQMLDNAGLTRTADQNMNRILDKYYGDGDYWSDLGSNLYKNVITPVGHWGSRALGGISGAVGGAEAGIPGMLMGGATGWNAGAEFSKAMGWGDYSIRGGRNQIIKGGTPPPLAVNGDLSGDVYLSHREFIGNVETSVTGAGVQTSSFQIREYPLNPGLAATFPFLSQIAKQFEMYEFRGLMFQFVSTYGESVSGANNLGKVIMATNYDPDATDFKNSMHMQNYAYSQCFKPSEHAVHGVETHSEKRATDLLYIRTDALQSKDKIFTDIGKFCLATEGIPHQAANSTAIVGELWVSYQVKLSRPKLYEMGEHQMVDTIHLSTSFDSLTHNTNPDIHSIANVNSAKFSSYSIGRTKLEYYNTSSVDLVLQDLRKGQLLKINAYWTPDGTIGKAAGDMIGVALEESLQGNLEEIGVSNGSTSSTLDSVKGRTFTYAVTTAVDVTTNVPSATNFVRATANGDGKIRYYLIGYAVNSTGGAASSFSLPAGQMCFTVDYAPAETVSSTKIGSTSVVHDNHTSAAPLVSSIKWEMTNHITP